MLFDWVGPSRVMDQDHELKFPTIWWAKICFILFAMPPIVYPSIHPSIHLSICLCVYLFVYLSICLSAYRDVCIYTYMYIYICVYIYIYTYWCWHWYWHYYVSRILPDIYTQTFLETTGSHAKPAPGTPPRAQPLAPRDGMGRTSTGAVLQGQQRKRRSCCMKVTRQSPRKWE